jgi:hypothetical protein
LAKFDHSKSKISLLNKKYTRTFPFLVPISFSAATEIFAFYFFLFLPFGNFVTVVEQSGVQGQIEINPEQGRPSNFPLT